MWIRWYPIQWLHSTCRDELEPAERATFQDFVCLAAISSTPGKFKYTDEAGLARQLKTPVDIIHSTIQKCEVAARIVITQDVEGYYFEIVKWGRYQVYLSDEEYQRKVNRNYSVNKNGHKSRGIVNKNEHQNRAEQNIDPPIVPPLIRRGQKSGRKYWGKRVGAADYPGFKKDPGSHS